MKKKTCMITGASRGLGQLLSQYFAKLGFNLILVTSNLKTLKSSSKSIELDQDQRMLLVEANFLKKGFEVKMFEEINNFCSTVDILINNAAIQGPIGPFLNLDFNDWEDSIRVNFLSTALVTKKTLDFMNNKKGGAVINLSGGGSAGLRPNLSAYACSKTALVRFTETVASELENTNINMNAIAPGAMPTDMMRELIDMPENIIGKKERLLAKKTLESDFNVGDIGDLCLFLSQPTSRKISGKLISVKWDNWENWLNHIEQLDKSDLYTLRRITARDKGFAWGDK